MLGWRGEAHNCLAHRFAYRHAGPTRLPSTRQDEVGTAPRSKARLFARRVHMLGEECNRHGKRTPLAKKQKNTNDRGVQTSVRHTTLERTLHVRFHGDTARPRLDHPACAGRLQRRTLKTAAKGDSRHNTLRDLPQTKLVRCPNNACPANVCSTGRIPLPLHRNHSYASIHRTVLRTWTHILMRLCTETGHPRDDVSRLTNPLDNWAKLHCPSRAHVMYKDI